MLLWHTLHHTKNWYWRKAMAAPDATPARHKRATIWITDGENRVALGRRERPSTIRAGKRGRDEEMSGGNWRSLQAVLRDEYSLTRKARPDRTAQRLRRLARTTGLSRTDVDLLELVLRYHGGPAGRV